MDDLKCYVQTRYSYPEMRAVWTEESKLQRMIRIEILVAQAWAKLGHIPAEAVKQIQKVDNLDLNRIKEIETKTQHDVVAFITVFAEKIGPAAQYLHKGLTSSDVNDTVFAWQIKDAADIILNDINVVLETLRGLAIKYQSLPMIGRTHGVHAEPITLGLKFASWYSELVRNKARMRGARAEISYAKLSGAVGTYAHIPPEIEKYVCRKLGLYPEPVSTQIVPRDRYAVFIARLALLATGIERMATELRHLHRTEVGEVEEFFAKGQTGSSAMPHKRNPILCERLCGLARLIRGNVTPALENIVLWHERDISHSSVERVIFPDSTSLMDYMLRKLDSILKNLVVYPDKITKNLNLTQGLFSSESVLLVLMEKGLPRMEAYKLVQRNALSAVEQKVPFINLVRQDKEIRRYLSLKEISRCFDITDTLRYVEYIYKRAGIIKPRRGRT